MCKRHTINIIYARVKAKGILWGQEYKSKKEQEKEIFYEKI